MKFFKMLSFCLLVAVFSIGATKSVKRDTELSAEVDKLIDTELAVGSYIYFKIVFDCNH